MVDEEDRGVAVTDLALLFREPEEVYLAAVGEPEPLAARIMSDEPLSSLERSALAAFFRGELTRPKRSRGQRTLPHLATETKDYARNMRIQNSVVNIRYIMDVLRKNGEGYGRFKDVLAFVVEQDCLTSEETERVNRELKRAKPKNVTASEKKLPRAVIRFHKWLLKTGRLPEFPQPIGMFHRLYIQNGERREWLQALIDEPSDKD